MINDRQWQRRSDEWVEMLHRSNEEKQKSMEENRRRNTTFSFWLSRLSKKLKDT